LECAGGTDSRGLVIYATNIGMSFHYLPKLKNSSIPMDMTASKEAVTLHTLD
jgi:hypothetical protein